MSNGRDFYTIRSYLDYVPSYKDIQTNLELYIDYSPETVYHFSDGLICYCLTRTSRDWFIKTRGMYNPKGTFQTVYKAKDFLDALSKFRELTSNYLAFAMGEVDEEIPF